MTTVNRVSTLSDSDVQAMLEYWGNDVGAMLTDVLANNIPSDQSFSADDVIAYLLEISGANGVTYLDPDDAVVAELFAENESAVAEFYNLNSTNTDLEYLITDIEIFLESQGISMDAYNQAGEAISDYVAEFGAIDASSGSDSMLTELGNLISFFKKFDFATYLTLYILYELGPMIEEGIEVINEQNEEAMADLEDQIEIVGEATDPEDAEATAEVKAAEYNIQLIQNKVKAYDEVGKILVDLLELYNEQASSYAQRMKSARSNIIQNI